MNILIEDTINAWFAEFIANGDFALFADGLTGSEKVYLRRKGPSGKYLNAGTQHGWRTLGSSYNSVPISFPPGVEWRVEKMPSKYPASVGIVGDVVLGDSGVIEVEDPDPEPVDKTVTIAASASEIAEGSAVEFTVSGYACPITVSVVEAETTCDVTEYSFDTTSLNGNGIITLTTVNDEDVEESEVISVKFESSESGVDIQPANFTITVTSEDVAAVETDFSTVSHFVSVQDGPYTDGATWGNESPGVYGRDYPGPEDTCDIAHLVEISPEKSVETGINVVPGGHVVVKGKLKFSKFPIFSAETEITIDGGFLDLNGFGPDSEEYYRAFGFNAKNGATIKGPGMVGRAENYKYSMPWFNIEDTIFDGLTGFWTAGNDPAYCQKKPNVMRRVRFINCSGDFNFQGSQLRCRDDLATTFDRVVFEEGFRSYAFTAAKAATSTMNKVFFADAHQIRFNGKWDTSGAIYNNCPIYQEKGSVLNQTNPLLYITGRNSHNDAPIPWPGEGVWDGAYLLHTAENPHFFHLSKGYFDNGTFEFKGGVSENTTPGYDGGEVFSFESLETLGTPVRIHHNLAIDHASGVFVNALGNPQIVDLLVENNTVWTKPPNSNSGYYGALARSEGVNGAWTPDGSVTIRKNITANMDGSYASDNMAGVFLFNPTTDSFDYVDQNAWYKMSDIYVGVTSSTLTEGVDEGFGALDVIDVDPQFIDPTRCFAQYDAMKGGPGTVENGFEQFKQSILNPAPAYSIPEMVAWVREGFKPQALEYNLGNGEFIGAISPE